MLATVAKRKSLFDDRPVEINELTYVIKQDLSSLNAQISSLQGLTKAQNPRNTAEQEGEHNKNVSLHRRAKRFSTAKRKPGCGPLAGQVSRRRSQLQGSARGANEEPASFAVTTRQFRQLSLCPFPTFTRRSAICITPIQHPHQIADPSAWLPEHQQ